MASTVSITTRQREDSTGRRAKNWETARTCSSRSCGGAFRLTPAASAWDAGTNCPFSE